MLKPVIKVHEIIQRFKKYFYKNLQILRIRCSKQRGRNYVISNVWKIIDFVCLGIINEVVLITNLT